MIAVLSGSCGRDRLDEAAVDLQRVEIGAAQIAERGIAGAEIVHGELHAEALDLLEHLLGGAGQLEEHGLGDLELEPARLQAGLGQRGDEGDDEAGIAQLARARR